MADETWHASIPRDEDEEEIDIRSSKGTIATLRIWSWEEDDDGVMQPDEEVVRRAHLIAAAPDLLEALQDLLEGCIREYGQPEDGEADESVGWIKDRETGSSRPMPFTYGLMQRARAALSKALPAPPETKGA